MPLITVLSASYEGAYLKAQTDATKFPEQVAHMDRVYKGKVTREKAKDWVVGAFSRGEHKTTEGAEMMAQVLGWVVWKTSPAIEELARAGGYTFHYEITRKGTVVNFRLSMYETALWTDQQLAESAARRGPPSFDPDKPALSITIGSPLPGLPGGSQLKH